MSIVFRCQCGHDLSAPDDQAGQHVECPACGSRAEVPPPLGPPIRIEKDELDLGPPRRRAESRSDVYAVQRTGEPGDAETPARRMRANRRLAGKTCAICQDKIDLGEDVCICDYCKLPFHGDCWAENGGCGSYGCRGAPGRSVRAEDVEVRVPSAAAGGHAADRRQAYEAAQRVLHGAPAHEPLYRETSGLAVASLVLGIMGLLICPPIGPLVAVILGHVALRRIDESGGRLGGRGLAIAGLVLGYIFLVLTLPFFLLSL